MSSHCKLHSVRLFLLGTDFMDDTVIYERGALGDFVPVDEKTSVSSLDVPYSLENVLVIVWNALVPFKFSGPFMRCRYSWALPVLRHITAFTIPGCRVGSTVAWLITQQSSPAEFKRGAGLMVAAVGVFMVATWFYMRSCPWRKRVRVLYLCTCGTVGFSFTFICADGGIGSISFVCGANWGGCIGGCTLGGGAGADSGLSNIGDGMGVFCSCVTEFGGV